jgi:hypothetical protein
MNINVLSHDCELILRRRMELLTCRRCSLDWFHSTGFNRLFTLFLYDFFLPSPPKPCGYWTFLIMKQHVSFSPNLYTTARHVLRNDAPWPSSAKAIETGLFLSAGRRCWGWVYKTHQNKYQIINDNGLNFSHFKNITFDIWVIWLVSSVNE